MSPTPEDELSAVLRHHADSSPPSSLDLTAIRGRARRIQRRRRVAAAGAGLAAAVAILVPAGMLVDRDGPRTIQPASRPTPISAPISIPAALLGSAPTGDSLGIPWADGGVVALPDGTTRDTDAAVIRDAVLVSGGLSVTTWSEAKQQTDLRMRVGEDRAGSDTPIRGVAVPNDERTAVAYIDVTGQLLLATPDGGLATQQSVGDNKTLVAFEGPKDCGGEGCHFWLNSTGPGGGAQRIDVVMDGDRARPTSATVRIPGALALGDATGDLAAATTSVDESEPGSCGALLKDGRALWETCDNTLESFSPDASWVIGTDPYHSGAGVGTVDVLDTQTGEQLVEFTAGDGYFTQRQWEDASHLALIHFSPADQTWRVVRAGLDGKVEVIAATPGSSDSLPYVLGQ